MPTTLISLLSPPGLPLPPQALRSRTQRLQPQGRSPLFSRQSCCVFFAATNPNRSWKPGLRHFPRIHARPESRILRTDDDGGDSGCHQRALRRLRLREARCPEETSGARLAQHAWRARAHFWRRHGRRRVSFASFAYATLDRVRTLKASPKSSILSTQSIAHAPCRVRRERGNARLICSARVTGPPLSLPAPHAQGSPFSRSQFRRRQPLR